MDLLPYLMDVDTFQRYIDKGVEYDQEYVQKLQRIFADLSYLDWKPLVQVMITTGKRIEQEIILYDMDSFELLEE